MAIRKAVPSYISTAGLDQSADQHPAERAQQDKEVAGNDRCRVATISGGVPSSRKKIYTVASDAMAFDSIHAEAPESDRLPPRFVCRAVGVLGRFCGLQTVIAFSW